MTAPDHSPIDPLLTVPKVAEIFAVKPETVRDWIKAGKIKGQKVNGYWRIARSEVIRFGNLKFGADA